MEFLAVTMKGLAETLESELKEIGLAVSRTDEAGVWFKGNWSDVYRANMFSRIANRIVYPLKNFHCSDQEQLYKQVRELDLSPYLRKNGRFLVDATVRDCKELRDQRFVAMKVKDAIVDRFRDTCGERPSIDKDDPECRFIIRGYRGDFTFFVDTSGVSLFQRGYRLHAGDAPLKETLAAGLIRMSGWDLQAPFIDIMCGSGTVPIEACLMALKIAPGTLRDRFFFENFETFESEVFEKIRDEAFEAELDEPGVEILGYDKESRAVSAARKNAKRAGVSKFVFLARSDFMRVHTKDDVAALVADGIHLFANPPYGERMGDPYELIDMYRNLGFTLKTEFPGSTAWILSGNKDLVGELKLKSFQNYTVMNGPLNCRFLGYKMSQR